MKKPMIYPVPNKVEYKVT